MVADILQEMDIQEAAMTYTNNDYGKGLADSIAANVEMRGGTITMSAPHEGGKGIIQASLDSGAFDQFFLPDGMIGDSLVEAIGADLNGSIRTESAGTRLRPICRRMEAAPCRSTFP